MGYTGIAYRVRYFGDDIFEYLKKLPSGCFFHDDVWLSGYLYKKGIQRYYYPFVPDPNHFMKHPNMSINSISDTQSRHQLPCVEYFDRFGWNWASQDFNRQNECFRSSPTFLLAIVSTVSLLCAARNPSPLLDFHSSLVTGWILLIVCLCSLLLALTSQRRSNFKMILSVSWSSTALLKHLCFSLNFI